jgi:hypothetical protein
MFVCMYIYIYLYTYIYIYVYKCIYTFHTEIVQRSDDIEDLNTRKTRKMYVHMMEIGALSHLRALQGQYMYISMFVNMCVYRFIYIYMYTYTYVYVCMYSSKYVCIYVCMYRYT